MKRARVLLADDHKIVAEGLRSLLEPEFELVGIVEDGRSLLEATEKLAPEVIVADISMPLLNGIEAARQIKKKSPQVRIVFLTMHPDVAYATRAFEAGASGYVLKHSAPSELITAIREAIQGHTYVTPILAGELMQSLKQETHSGKSTLQTLTPREREVLQLLAEGRTAKEVAAILHISPRTAEFHKSQIKEKLNLKTTADLVQFAIRQGLVSI